MGDGAVTGMYLRSERGMWHLQGARGWGGRAASGVVSLVGWGF